MKTNLTDDHNMLLKLVTKGLKYFLLVLVGFAIAYVISIILGGTQIVSPLLPSLGDWVVRLGTILLCLIGIAIIVESWR